jgi:hypothetical protein
MKVDVLPELILILEGFQQGVLHQVMAFLFILSESSAQQP